MTAEAAEQPPRPWLNWLGLGLLAAALALSGARVLSIQREHDDGSRVTVRIAHWQLEQGYREALQRVIDDYNRLHAGARVEVRQVPVTEKIYAAWLNTQLVADEAPDIAEVGKARLTSVGESLAKFFSPLGDEIAKPNPYNRPELLDLAPEDRADPALVARLQGPWMDTLVDGMRGGYRDDLQEWFSIPTTVTSVRLFYNADLLKQATGSDQPPRSLGELFAACDQLRALKDPSGRPLHPIAGSQYTMAMLVPRYLNLFTASWRQRPDLDLDQDGALSQLESWGALHAGRVSFADPPLAEGHRFARRLCDQFTPGFTGMDRDQSAFAFIQRRAAMIASGSWDAGTLFRQAERHFRVGACDFPLPAPGEPWHDLVHTRANEAATNGGVTYAVSRTARHRERALDFLRYLTSQAVNQRFNRENDWVPVTIGATPSPRMRPFVPDPRGIGAGLDLRNGGDVQTTFNGAQPKFLSGETDYAQFSATMARTLADDGAKLWRKHLEGGRDAVRSLERALAVQHLRGVVLGADDAAGKRARQLAQQALHFNGELGRLRWRMLFPDAKPSDGKAWPW